ncbi:polymorphic toxin type 23 domain-containing protein [Halpernia sp.]|uniref:polymorphic toxin type 23 domain-containing protein n=1 Tax=Halpernia sp. TaxID=2782209 RepID=UPI003A95A7C1
MKKIYFLVASALSLLCNAQTILNQTETTTRTVQDPQAVILTPGFRAVSTTSNPFIAKIGASTDTGGSPVDSGAGGANPSGTTDTPTNKFHDTQGNIDVTGGGQLQYTLPIALPPGIKSVAPQVNLVYTSGSGNGIAGYGWSISGLSSISRMGKTIEKDGEVAGINLDYSDYYSFNGQRLILKSDSPATYGKSGATYTTEKYSNVLIKSLGSITGQLWTGPEYWEVTFEDGSQAWYGATTTGASTARTPIEYNIVKWKDAQGNYITYNYTQSNNVAVISNVQWGANETVAGSQNFNKIEFNYSARILKEQSFVNGVEFIQDKLLENVLVSTNGAQFKKYVVNYESPNINNDTTNTLSYQFVKSVQEFNSQNESANPITFTTKSLVTSTSEKPFGDFQNVITSGDYNGDGFIDFILRQPAQNGKPEGDYIYFDAINNTAPPYVYLGPSSAYLTSTLLTFNIKPADNYIKPKQGLIITSNNNSDPHTTGNLELNYYSIKSDSSVLNTTTNPLVLEYTKTINASQINFDDNLYSITPPSYNYISESKKSQPIDFKEVDIDSDGLSELIFSVADAKCYQRVIVEDPLKTTWLCNNLGYRTIVIDNSDLIANTIHTILPPTDKDILAKSSILDFDNDGVQDIISIKAKETNESVSFYTKQGLTGEVVQQTVSTPLNDVFQYSIKKSNNNYVVALKNTFLVKGYTDAIQFGDLNGDRNIEILAPLNKGSQSSVYNQGWSIYLNNGAGLSEFLQGFASYYKNDNPSNTYQDYTYPGMVDLDNDGKSDFVNFYAGYNYQGSGFSNLILWKYSEFQYNPTNPQFRWSYKMTTLFTNLKGGTQMTPVYGNFRINNTVSKINFISNSLTDANDRKIISYNHYSLSNDKNINSVTQGGINTQIDYKELDPTVNPNFYAPVKKEQYPYVELDKVSQSFAVSQLQQNITVNGTPLIRLQDFRYRGMITHLQGRGMIGFRQTARSSWYAAGFENTKIWSGAEIDPLNEGVPVKEWSIHTNIESQIFPTDLSVNNTQLTSFKSTTYKTDKLLNNVVQTGTISDANKTKIVTAIVPTSTTSKNFITNDTTTDTVEYGSYYLPNKTISNINSGYGIKTTTLDYTHNLTGVGKDYFVGRPQSKTETMVAYGDTKSAKVDYTYANNLLDTQKTWNRDNTGWLQEKYTYDGFGNITQKVSSNSIDANKQTIKSTYEPQGRFVTKTTDNLGLETNITYNDWGQVLTQINPLLNKLTNTYDAWGKLLTTKNNLSGTTSYTYEKLGNGDTKVTEYSPDNDQKITYTNNLGQNYKSTTKGFVQGVYTSKSVEFDILGRKTKDSEPYFEGSETPRWNVIAYDDTVYPGKATATAFNGKKMETSVSGKTTSVKELNGYNRTNTKTTDALGNVVSTTDKGGTITFAYNAAGEQTEAKYDTNSVKTTYDAWGNKIKFDDPSNGVYEYTYQGYFGTISKIKSPKGTKEYTYNSLGQLITQKETSTDGTSTNKVIAFSYDDKGRVIGKSGTSKGEAFSSYINFDSQGKTISSGESSNGKYFMQKGITYDDKARVSSYEKSLYSSGILTKVTIENVYSSWSGDLYQVKDKTSGKILWQLDETNAKGLVKSAKLGGTTINNLYDANYFLINTSHTKTVGGNTVLQMGYTFNAIKNELTHRTRGGDFNLSESFTYDDNNRLLNWTNPKTGVLSNNVYDIKGRITSNDQVGTIKFENTTSLYRPSSVVLNAAGTANYNNDLIQTISYNENNDPIFIDGIKGDVAFQYGLTAMRQRVTYGGNFAADQEGKFTKFYSEDGSYEILKDNVTGKEKHLLYIGGTPYDSNIVFIKNYTETKGSYKFLHKDYLGSILAVSDENGNALEQRHYDAWGNFTHLKIGTGAIITDKNIIDNTALLIDRGYTSHEHFAEVGIIHMNGRLYDPLLRRFLNADENIQDPTNTQNYNKYGYVLNNPLIYSDSNGEWFGIDDLIVAAASFVIGYVSHGIMTGQWGWSAVKAGFQFAIMGWISYNTAGLASGKVSSVMWNFVGNSAINTAISCVIPPMNISIEDFDFSISPSIAIGNGWGFGANISATFHAGDFSISGGFGLMHYGGHAGSGASGWEYRKSAMLGYSSKAFSMSLGTNKWSGLHPQQTGIIGLGSGDFSLTYENDGSPFASGPSGTHLGDNNDRWRTAAMTVNIGDFHAGFNLFTGERYSNSYYENLGHDYPTMIGMELGRANNWGDYIDGGYGAKLKYGLVEEIGPRYRLGAAYIGWGNYRIGIDSDRHVRHPIQNVLAHQWISPQPGFQVLSGGMKSYFQYQTRNKFTSW